MPGPRPEPDGADVAGDLGAVERPELLVGDGLDRDRPGGDQHGQPVEGAHRPGSHAQGRIEGQATQPDLQGREQVQAEQALRPVRMAVGAHRGVAPVLVLEAGPVAGPVGGEPQGPREHQGDHQSLAGAGRAGLGDGEEVERHHRRGHAPVGVEHRGVVDRPAAGEQHQGPGHHAHAGDPQRVGVVDEGACPDARGDGDDVGAGDHGEGHRSRRRVPGADAYLLVHPSVLL